MAILITGGSKGIGRGVAERFAADGAHVIIGYSHDDEAAASAQAAVAERGGRCTLVKADLSTPDGLDVLVRGVNAATDHLDQIVHGAVRAVKTMALDMSADDFAKVVWVNGSVFLSLVQGLRPLLAAGSSIFFISGRGAKLVVPEYVAIGAPKALAEALVRYLAVELAPAGIRVNSVSPSSVLTDSIRVIRADADARFAALAAKNPSGRNIEPADVGALIHHLSSADLSLATGRDYVLDGASGIFLG